MEGYVKEGIVDGIVVGNSRVLFGEQALQNSLHADLVPPLAEGVISRLEAARDFLRHVGGIADLSGQVADRQDLSGVDRSDLARLLRQRGDAPSKHRRYRSRLAGEGHRHSPSSSVSPTTATKRPKSNWPARTTNARSRWVP